MIALFPVAKTEQSELYYNFYCERCSKTTVRHHERTGVMIAEDAHPNHVPSSRHCPECGDRAAFMSAQIKPIWTRSDTGEQFTDLNSQHGACYHEPNGIKDPTTQQQRFGADGQCLVVIVPDFGRWYIDGRSSRCSKKSDAEHYCYTRSGSLSEGTLSVTKDGNSCGGCSDVIDVNGVPMILKNNHFQEA